MFCSNSEKFFFHTTKFFILYYLIFLFHVTDTRTIFALLLAKDQLKWLMAWQTVVNVCHFWHLTAVFCIKFHALNFTLISDHVTVTNNIWLLLNVKKECGVFGRYKHQTALVPLIQRPAQDIIFFTIIWTTVIKLHLQVLRQNGNFTYKELVCLMRWEIPLLFVPSWFPCERAHDDVLSIIVKTYAPVWPNKLSSTISDDALWTCSNSFISIDLANDHKSFSVRIFTWNPGSLTFLQHD